MVAIVVFLAFALCSAQKQITCRHRTQMIPTTPLNAPTHLPKPHVPKSKSYPGNIPSPCIKLRITLETENLLPLNIEPDPASNINIISEAITNFTGGTFELTETPDFDEDDPDSYDKNELKWEIPDECMIDNQKTDSFMPIKKILIDTGDATVTQTTDSFNITYTLTTNASILYVFNIHTLPLNIATNCKSAHLTISGAIYKHNELIGKTDNVQISSRDQRPLPRIFYFGKYIWLTPATEYQVRHELIDGYPTGCNFDNVQFGTKRRLQSQITINADVFAQATPNACQIGAQVGISPEMRNGVSNMCNDKLNTRIDIQQGLFRQHNSQSAIRNFLIKTGSLSVYNEDGTIRFTALDFPQYNIEEPCVAIDNDSNIIYAIGGHFPNGTASKYIQAYKFNDDLMSGNIIQLNNWILDKPRYGSTCFFYKDAFDFGHIFVMSGMAHNNTEFTNKRNFYQDMKIFHLPKNYSHSMPHSMGPTKRVAINIIDNKPLLIDNILYFFGGKTHKTSKQFVSRVDLNRIGDANSAVVEAMRMQTNVSLPLIDLVVVDFGAQGTKTCHMAFGGQTYKNFQIYGDVATDLMQLYCNPNLPSGINTRRLMEQKNILTLTVFDLEMLGKHKSQNKNMTTNTYKRRLRAKDSKYDKDSKQDKHDKHDKHDKDSKKTKKKHSKGKHDSRSSWHSRYTWQTT
eukprot:486900_1